MKPSSFPKEMKQDAKKFDAALVRLQYDTRHLGDTGVGIEVVGPAPLWVVDAIDSILKRWREEDSEAQDRLH